MQSHKNYSAVQYPVFNGHLSSILYSFNILIFQLRHWLDDFFKRETPPAGEKSKQVVAMRQLRGDRNGLPAAVQLPVRIGDQNNFQWGGQHAGFLGPKFDPLMLIDEKWTPGTLVRIALKCHVETWI